MKKYRIKIFSSFCDSTNCKLVYERLCQVDLMTNYGPDKEIYIVGEGEEYTHVILMNLAMPQISNSSEIKKIVGISCEPVELLMRMPQFDAFVEYANKHVSKYLMGYNGESIGLPTLFTAHYSYMWHITPPRRILHKNRMMSIVVSEKGYTPGHQYRHTLVQAILSTNYNIDIYGRGCNKYGSDPRLKGIFNDDEPYENYHFHICIENFQSASYTSEKYTNAILWGATPIYWGASEIDSLFPGLTVKLSGNVNEDMRLIESIIYHPLEYKKEISQDAVRTKLNILQNLDTLFS
jgi:hypothetical protein